MLQSLAQLVTEEDLNKGSLYPPLTTIQECSIKVATRVAEFAYEKGILIFIYTYIFFPLSSTLIGILTNNLTTIDNSWSKLIKSNLAELSITVVYNLHIFCVLFTN